MRVFEGNTSSYESKINFVDEFDVFVGYDMNQSCCEHAGWYIDNKLTPYKIYEASLSEILGLEKLNKLLEDYRFDNTYYDTYDSSDNLCEDIDDCGGIVVFTLVSEGKEALYLHLFNSHNGFYSHGFEISMAGLPVGEGSI